MDSAAVQAVEELAREIDMPKGCDVGQVKHGLQSTLIVVFSVAVTDRLAKLHRHRLGDTRLTMPIESKYSKYNVEIRQDIHVVLGCHITPLLVKSLPL